MDKYIPTAAGVNAYIDAYLDQIKMLSELGFATGRGDREKVKDILDHKPRTLEEYKAKFGGEIGTTFAYPSKDDK